MSMEEWKTSVLNSLEGIEKAAPPADLLSRIQSNIDNTEVFKTVTWYWAAASIAVVITLNVFTAINHVDSKSDTVEETIPMSIGSDFNIYES